MRGLPKDKTVDSIDFVKDLTYHEVHLFVEGAFDGFIQIKPKYTKKVQGKVTGDSWYYKGGFIIFYLVRVVIVIALAVMELNGQI